MLRGNLRNVSKFVICVRVTGDTRVYGNRQDNPAYLPTGVGEDIVFTVFYDRDGEKGKHLANSVTGIRGHE
jgi:hypothetical protein